MFKVNGIALQNAAYGWRELSASEPETAKQRNLVQLQAAGRDGSVAGIPGAVPPPYAMFVVRTPWATRESFRALMKNASTLQYAEDPSTFAVVEWAGTTVDTVTRAHGGIYDHTVSLRLPDVYWRDVVAQATGQISLTSGVVQAFPGSSGPIRDSVVRIKGYAASVSVLGANGTSFSFGEIQGGQYFRFEAATGRAFITSSDVWAGGMEVTGAVGAGGGFYPLDLVPSFTDPGDRHVLIPASAVAPAGATIEVRGRGSYDR